MNAFLVDLENKPGALAAVAEALAAKAINITGVAGATCGDSARAALTTSDPAATRQALETIHASFKELEITDVTLAHQPGTLARATRRLASAGINVEAIFPMGMAGNDIQVGFVTSDPVKAREVLATATAAR